MIRQLRPHRSQQPNSPRLRKATVLCRPRTNSSKVRWIACPPRLTSLPLRRLKPQARRIWASSLPPCSMSATHSAHRPKTCPVSWLPPSSRLWWPSSRPLRFSSSMQGLMKPRSKSPRPSSRMSVPSSRPCRFSSLPSSCRNRSSVKPSCANRSPRLSQAPKPAACRRSQELQPAPIRSRSAPLPC